MLQLPGYTIDKEIGKGGMARVYLAVQERLERKVAIKVMSTQLDRNQDFSARFLREARIVASLNHQNIVTIYNVGVHDGHHYLAMEYLPGAITLDDKIKQGISPEAGLQTIKQVAAALGYAHGKGVVHRDVKPENIMYREDGSAVLTDFGIARLLDATTRLTATGTMIGTPHYMSPEQFKGEELDRRADIYSLGVVLYEVLTGKVPYEGDMASLSHKHVFEPVPKLEGRLAIYQPVLDCMMAKDKQNRYQNCDEIIADIGNLLAGDDASNATTVIKNVLEATGVQKTRKPAFGIARLKQKSLIASIAVGFVVIALAAVYIIYEQNQVVLDEQRLARPKKQEDQRLLEEAQRLKDKQDEVRGLAETKRAQEEKTKRLAAQKKAAEEKAKQHAALERKRREEARLAKIKAERDKARREKQKKITALLTEAETHLENRRLKAASQNYKNILEFDPSNAKAKNGINVIADRYLARARTSSIANDYQEANVYLGAAIEIAPTHGRLVSIQREIIQRENQYLAEQERTEQAGQESRSKSSNNDQISELSNINKPARLTAMRRVGAVHKIYKDWGLIVVQLDDGFIGGLKVDETVYLQDNANFIRFKVAKIISSNTVSVTNRGDLGDIKKGDIVFVR